jgi:hypothetical protein
MSKTIKELEKQIEDRKILLKALKSRDKEGQVFSETAIGTFCLETIKTISLPFVHLYGIADNKINSVEADREKKLWKKSKKLYLRADTILRKAEGLKREDKESDKCIIKIIKLLADAENNRYFNNDDIKESLRAEIERLRPQKSEETETIIDQVSNLIDEEINNVINSNLPSDTHNGSVHNSLPQTTKKDEAIYREKQSND